jgi:hypothetical protein
MLRLARPKSSHHLITGSFNIVGSAMFVILFVSQMIVAPLFDWPSKRNPFVGIPYIHHIITKADVFDFDWDAGSLIVLSIDKKNRFYVNEKLVLPTELRSALQEKIKQIGGPSWLRLYAYRNLKMESINDMLPVLRSVGIERINLIVKY